MDVEQLLNVTEKLASFGYEVASLSGGEPTLYRDLGRLCRGLRSQGYTISIISNGIRPSVIKDLISIEAIDFVGISFDGLPSLHDAIRNRRGAFEIAKQTLTNVSAQFGPTGAVVSVTNGTLPHLPRLVENLVSASPTKIHFRPIASVGRAALQKTGEFDQLPEEALFRLSLLSKLFGEIWPKVGFECDVVLSPQLSGLEIGSSDVISPIVIREDGSISPFVYDRAINADLCGVDEDSFSPLLSDSMLQNIRTAVDVCKAKTASDFYSELSAVMKQSGG